MMMKKLMCAGLGALMLTESCFAAVPAAASETNGPHWAFTYNAGDLPEDRGTPADDLNLYVNYDYLAANQDTADQASLYLETMDEPKQKLMEIIEDSSYDSHDLEQLRLFYNQALDMEAREADGLSGIQPYLDRISKADTIEELNKVLTSESFPFETFALSMIGSSDLSKDAAVLILPKYLAADSMDGAFYMKDDADTTTVFYNALQETESRQTAMLALSRLDTGLSYNDLERFERQYGQYGPDSSYSGKGSGVDPSEWGNYYHYYTMEELESLTEHFPLAALLKKEGRDGAETYSVQGEQWIQVLDALWTNDNLDILKAIAQVQILTECAPYLDPAFQITATSVTASYSDETADSAEADSAEIQDSSTIIVSLMASDICYYLDRFTITEMTDVLYPMIEKYVNEYLGDFAFLVKPALRYLTTMADDFDPKPMVEKLLKTEWIADLVSEFYHKLPEILQSISLEVADNTSGKTGLSSSDWADLDSMAYEACNSTETFSHLLSSLYTDECIGEEGKDRLTQLTSDLIASYKELMSKTEWLDDESRENLYKKLDLMRLNVLQPDGGYISYDGLELVSSEEGGTFFENYLLVKKYVREQENAMIGQPALANMCWYYYTPLTYNCFYDPDSNSINILPGFLNSFHYTDDMSDEDLLGGIGYVIGHEISHGFDYCGNHYNAYGVLENCISEEAQDTYDSILNKLAAYYDSIELTDGVYADGDAVLVEATADLCANELMLEYAEGLEDFDYEKFYTRIAQEWATVTSDGSYLLVTALDTHPLDYLRVNVNVQMYDKFYETFDVKEGDGMYLAPEDRIVVW